MSSKKVAKFMRKTNLMSNIADETGVSKSNFFVRLTNPADEVLRDTEREGSSGYTDFLKEGGMTDPGHIFHGDVNETPDPGSPDQTATAPAAQKARDRMRRLAYRAQGRSSTIKVSPSAATYTGEQKALLGS